MSKYGYDRLTFLDNSFLLMEGSNSPMHVAGTATYEVGPLKQRDGGIDIDKIRDYVNVAAAPDSALPAAAGVHSGRGSGGLGR